MRILIKAAHIHDPQSKHHGTTRDLLLVDGVIKEIATQIDTNYDTLISAQGLELSPGWTDLKADFCEPGNEHKETLESGAAAAERGGFTHVCLVPATTPPVDNKAQIEFLKNKNQYASVEVIPTGCLSVGHEGKELSEMFDMSQSGAALFTDDQQHVSTGLLYRALLYVKNFGAKIAVTVNDTGISKHGIVNEGLASTTTGLKAIPSIAEILDIERCLRLVEYTDSSIHLSGLSTREGVALIREAKSKGLSITADVHVNQLLFDETAVLGFDSNFKVLPPYRTAEDKQALWEGVIDGTIDAIVSDHRPAHEDEKELEFDYASFGNITLEVLFPALLSCETFELNAVLRSLTQGPAKVLGRSVAKIEVNENADLTLFSRVEKTKIDKDSLASLSFNTPFLDTEMAGRIIGVINQGRLALSKLEQHA
jgi:dihydroorotase